MIDLVFIEIATLLSLFSASILLLIWVFRPKSKQLYKKISSIPLIDNNIESIINREGPKK